MPTRRFAPLPYGMIQDPQLPAELRAMGFLCTHDPHRSGDTFSANRQSIAAATGLHETTVSKVTERLVASGWLIKYPAKRGQSTKYAINWGGGPATPNSKNGVPHPPPQEGGNGVADRPPQQAPNGVPHPPPQEVNGVPHPPPQHLIYKDRSIDTLYSRSVSTRAQENSPTDFSFSEAAKILQGHGVPERYFFHSTDRRLILSWSADGYEAKQIESACQIAKDQRARAKDPQPIGPRYVDSILRSMDHNAADAAGGGESESLQQKDYGDGAW